MSRFLRIIPLLALSLVLINCPSTPKTPETVAAPTFTPAAGVYTSAQSVAMATTTAGAEIRYTTDGTDPSATTGTVYTGPVSVAASMTLKAVAVMKDWTDSAVVGAVYTITGTVAAVTFSPAPGSFTGSVDVTLASATPGVEIRYTTDGTAPSATTGTVYAGPVRLTSSATVNALAVKKDWAPSAVASAAYTVSAAVAAVTDEEVEAVRGAIARAREFDAELYDPDNLARPAPASTGAWRSAPRIRRRRVPRWSTRRTRPISRTRTRSPGVPRTWAGAWRRRGSACSCRKPTGGFPPNTRAPRAASRSRPACSAVRITRVPAHGLTRR